MAPLSEATREALADEMQAERSEIWPGQIVHYLQLRAEVRACRGEAS